ncbi:MAG: integrin alpha [Deltaproteobacteria bacterium]|nr:integrin alpha [Deltaproteobacteria bacterium]
MSYRSLRHFCKRAFILLALLCQVPTAAEAPDPTSDVIGHVLFHQKISSTEGGFIGALDDVDGFGRSVTSLGDLDGDGNADLAVGASGDDDGGDARGAVWILFLHPNGTVKSHQKISSTEGGFTGALNDIDSFGLSVASPGDLDGDGIPDLAVGAPFDGDGAVASGALWILFLHPNGTVKSHQKISNTEGGFTGSLGPNSLFGIGLASVGDLDRDGHGDLGVGASGDSNGGASRGAVWILFLHPDGTVKNHQKISSTEGGFSGTLDSDDSFGISVTSLGDFDRDGNADLAVGARQDDDGGPDRGAAWILFLHGDGTVKTHQKISDTQGGFTGTLEDNDWFGRGVASLGDLDCDGNTDLAISAPNDDDGEMESGTAWLQFLSPQGTVQFHTKISSTSGGFTGPLEPDDRFGSSLALVGDLDGDGNADLAVGANGNDGGFRRGAVWILFLDGNGCFAKNLFSDGFESGDTSAWSLTVP